ncbi:MAG: hypothetical protein V1726_00645 [Methanobacteriota archaeon]
MAVVSNSMVISGLLRTFIRVIGRRTSESFAIETIGNVAKNLQPTFSFFKYIDIQSALYSGEMDAVKIDSAIDAIDSVLLGEAIGKIIDSIAISLGENEQFDFDNAEYYFINEVKDSLGEEVNAIFKKNYDVDLTLKQSDFLAAMQEAAKTKIRRIRTSEVLEYTIRSLLAVLNRKIAEPDAIKLMVTTLKKLEKEYSFFASVNIRDTPDSNGLYPIHIENDIDEDVPPKRGGGIQQLIFEVALSTNMKTRRVFVGEVIRDLGPKVMGQLRKIGVKLDQIEKDLEQRLYQGLTKKTFEVIITLIGKKTSPRFAVALVDTVIEQLRETHAVLSYITIDKTRYDEGINAFQFAPEINTVEEYKLGKALKEILKKTQDNLESEAVNFVEDFKKYIGDDSLSELEKIGVNLHILELRSFF